MENEKTDLILTDRIKLNVNGVKKIKSSEPEQIVLILSNSAMVIAGINLFVMSASIQTGEVEITGLVNGIKYTGISAKRKFSFKNIFK
jgi:spore coat polysaccharide biosynthesis predicted glycosyltransferase SpsG